MKIVHTKSDVRAAVAAARAEGKTIGLVPTMGALHEGHLSLASGAAEACDFVIVSIFVNPTQFGPGEDLERYPRDLEGDARKLEEIGAHLIFAPDASEMYASDACTVVSVRALIDGLCGAYRPGHFDGVTTVVSKLFNIVTPDRAYFGLKDYQQFVVIRRMARDLEMPVEVIGLPTVREDDGLAMSSRNLYLTPEQRAAAPRLYQALQAGAEAARGGATGDEVQQIVTEMIAGEPLFKVQYVKAVDAHTLHPMDGNPGPMVIAVAAYLGDTRLIDNITVEG